jgi:CDP-diacylglycerol pyrophosphatase
LPGSYCLVSNTELASANLKITVRWKHMMGDITGHRLSVNREMTGSFHDVKNALTLAGNV